jgi:hypothetical protein
MNKTIIINAPRARPNKKPKKRSIDFRYVLLITEERKGANMEKIIRQTMKSKTNVKIIEISQDFCRYSPMSGADLSIGSA